MADTILRRYREGHDRLRPGLVRGHEEFFGSYTTNLINETSMKLLGYERPP